MSGKPLREMSLDELARLDEKNEVGSVDHERIMAELARRQTIAQIEATQAQKTASEAEEKAAKAIVDTALHTERSANYMFWSVIAATLSTMITAAGVLFHLFGRG
jgi:(p)ppGpp synthase/HD superfamily hydrolase